MPQQHGRHHQTGHQDLNHSKDLCVIYFLTDSTIMERGHHPGETHHNYDALRFEDETMRFKNCVAGLKCGEMISDFRFSLFASMSAVELFDEKMDSGLNYSKVLTIEGAMKQSLFPPELTLAQTVELMDALLAAEMTHYQGYSVYSTLFASFYVHQPDWIRDDSCIPVYIRALLKAVDVNRDGFMNADVYDEEDYAAVKVDGELCSSHTVFQLFEELTNAKSELNEKIAAAEHDAVCSVYTCTSLCIFR